VNIVQYRPQIAIIGSRNLSKENLQRVEDISFSLVEEKYRIVTGGLGSLQKYAHKGAKRSSHSGDGDTIAILPGFDPSPAIGHADIIIPTGLDILRNVIVANCDLVICIGGGAGTLSEIAFAWQLNRPIVSVGGSGWSSKLAGETLDHRFPDSKIIDCSNSTIEEIIDTVNNLTEQFRPRHTGIS
jgi:uncharacterized protein (TIGR00725 family)